VVDSLRWITIDPDQKLTTQALGISPRAFFLRWNGFKPERFAEEAAQTCNSQFAIFRFAQVAHGAIVESFADHFRS
jgi:hypothetical protein